MRHAELAEKLLNAILSSNRIVVHEAQLWRSLQFQTLAKLTAQKGGRPFEGSFAGRTGRGVAQRGVIDAGQVEIWADLSSRQGDKPDTGVVNLSCEQLSQFRTDLVGDSCGS